MCSPYHFTMADTSRPTAYPSAPGRALLFSNRNLLVNSFSWALEHALNTPSPVTIRDHGAVMTPGAKMGRTKSDAWSSTSTM